MYSKVFFTYFDLIIQYINRSKNFSVWDFEVGISVQKTKLKIGRLLSTSSCHIHIINE